MYEWIRSFAELFVVQSPQDVSHQVFVQTLLRGTLVKQKGRHFQSVLQADLPHSQCFDVHVLKYALNDGVGVALKCYVLLSVVADSVLPSDDSFGAVVHEHDGTFHSFLVLEHEGWEHAKLRGADHVDLKVLEVGVVGEL